MLVISRIALIGELGDDIAISKGTYAMTEVIGTVAAVLGVPRLCYTVDASSLGTEAN